MTRQLLIVEDETNIRSLLCTHLTSDGDDCMAVGTGREALDLVRSRPFDLIVLDVMLPETSGLSIGRTVRSGHVNSNGTAQLATRIRTTNARPEHAKYLGLSRPEGLTRKASNVVCRPD